MSDENQEPKTTEEFGEPVATYEGGSEQGVSRPRPSAIWKAASEKVEAARKARETAVSEAQNTLATSVETIDRETAETIKAAKAAGTGKIEAATNDVSDKETEVARLEQLLAKARGELATSKQTLRTTQKTVAREIRTATGDATAAAKQKKGAAKAAFAAANRETGAALSQAVSERRSETVSAIGERIDYDFRSAVQETVSHVGGTVGAVSAVAKNLASVAADGYREGYENTDIGVGPNSKKRLEKQGQGPNPPSQG